MEWFEITLNVPESLRESITNRLFEIGAEGVSETGEGAGHRLHAFFKPELKSVALQELSQYTQSLLSLFPKLPAVEFHHSNVADENWADRYKEFYKAQKLTGHFFLKPLWDKVTPVPHHMIPILMEPGQAFGTGLHPSTRLCIRFLEKLVRREGGIEGPRVLDVGTGSGILAIVASKLGASHVIAIDNDPIAVTTARENVEVNQCPDIQLSDKPLSTVKGNFPIVVSNILLETHRELASEYRRLVIPGGQLILSGLLTYQERELTEIIEPLGFTRDSSRYLQEWAAYSFIRRDSL